MMIKGLPRRVAGAVKRRAVNGYRASKTPRRIRAYDRLHLGCGDRLLDGWANLDIDGRGTLVWDLRKPLPLLPNSISFVYTEHFVEHIERHEAVKLLSHARKVMRPNGVLRVSTPDLKFLIEEYQAGNLASNPVGWYPKTLCQMVNEAMRLWGHTFVYDEAELHMVLREAGFTNVKRVKRGESDSSDLRNLESRSDMHDLIMEARP